MIRFLFFIAITSFIFLIFYGVIKSKVVPQKEIDKRLKALGAATGTNINENVRAKDTKEETPSFRDRVLIPIENTFGRFLTNLAPEVWREALNQKLIIAGKARTWTPEGYAIFWLFMICLGGFLSVRYVQGAQDMAFIQGITTILVGTAFSAAVPWLILRNLAEKRQVLIMKQLPEILDLLCISVQAGLTFDAATRRIVERMKGPLVEELGRMLDDTRMGLPRRQSMRMMADRCDVPDVSLFVTAIIQSERLGTSIGKTLTNQAANMRERRSQRARAKALKAPVKLVLPLVLFIFPTIFIVALLPSLLGMMKTFFK